MTHGTYPLRAGWKHTEYIDEKTARDMVGCPTDHWLNKTFRIEMSSLTRYLRGGPTVYAAYLHDFAWHKIETSDPEVILKALEFRAGDMKRALLDLEEMCEKIKVREARIERQLGGKGCG